MADREKLTLDELRKRHDEAQSKLNEARRAAQSASHAFYEAEHLEHGRQMRERLVGQIIVDVRSPWKSADKVRGEWDEVLEPGVLIILSNGVEITAEDSDDADGHLRISEPKVPRG